MFFLIPGGGGFFSILIIFLIIRLVFRSLFGNNRRDDSYTHYYYYNTNSQDQYRQYNNNNGYNPYQPRKNYYTILGLTSAATDDEIKKAYRKLIMEFHPDTIANKNLSEAEKERATKRFREVQEAYEEICKQRGIK